MSSESNDRAQANGQALVARELRRHRERAGLSRSELATRVGYSRTYISTCEKPGASLVSEAVVKVVDRELGAGGALIALHARADADRRARRPPARVPVAVASRRDVLLCACGAAVVAVVGQLCERCGASTRVSQALMVVTGEGEDLDAGVDALDAVVEHYAGSLHALRPADAYGDLVAARSAAGAMLRHPGPATRRRTALTISAGWASTLLGIVTSLMGDSAAALVWCSDAERHGRAAGHAELTAWAMSTRATMAWYRGDARAAADLSVRAQALVASGTAVHVRLASHEMRCHAALGDVPATDTASRRAAVSMARLQPGPPGVFSVMPSEEPPYTATSLLHIGRVDDAIAATGRVVEATRSISDGGLAARSSGFARALMILGLGYAMRGEVERAVASGGDALDAAPVVWPTVVLARRLDGLLAGRAPNAAAVAQFHDRFVEAAAEPLLGPA